MITTLHLNKFHGSQQVLHDVELNLPEQGMTSIIGPNGAGKSTLLSIISRLATATSGVVQIDGKAISEWDSEQLATRLAILRQDNHLSLRLTVRDLVAFGRYPYTKGHPTVNDKAHIDRALQYLDLCKLKDRYLDELSGGQRQRAFIAMVLCQDTHYVLLDEPLNSLDMKHAVVMMQTLRRAADDLGKAVIMVLHDINFAANYSDCIIAMRQGRVAYTGTPDQIITESVLSDLYDLPIKVHTLENQRICTFYR